MEATAGTRAHLLEWLTSKDLTVTNEGGATGALITACLDDDWMKTAQQFCTKLNRVRPRLRSHTQIHLLETMPTQKNAHRCLYRGLFISIKRGSEWKNPTMCGALHRTFQKSETLEQ